MSECRGPECDHPSHAAEERPPIVLDPGRRRVIPCTAREVLIEETDGSLTPTRTGPAPRARR